MTDRSAFSTGLGSLRKSDCHPGRDTQVGEIGLNGMDPSYAGKGMGTEMYDFAVIRMREAGMKVATVATGGDPSHAPARRARQKAGFSVEVPSVWMRRTL